MDTEAFSATFTAFLQRMTATAPPADAPVRRAVSDHLGSDPAALPVVREDLPATDHPNLQVALDAWRAGPRRASSSGRGAAEPIGSAGRSARQPATRRSPTGASSGSGPSASVLRRAMT